MTLMFLTCKGNIAGSTFSLFYLVSGLKNKGIPVIVGCPSNSELAGMCLNSGISDILIGCVSRISKRKRQDILIEALEKIQMPVKVLLIGARANSALKRKLAAVPPRHRVIFCGIVNPYESLLLTRVLTIAVLPSVMEGLSQSLLEAMRLKIPVIAARAGGNTDLIIHNQSGILFNANNPSSLAVEINRLLEDADLRNRFAENAFERVRKDFSIENTISNWQGYFHMLQSRKFVSETAGMAVAE
jgi:glycosyltransferase involved in cell wall biosynthesis